MSYETQIERLRRMSQDAEVSEPWKIEALESAMALMRASDDVQEICAENERLLKRNRQLLIDGIDGEFSLVADLRAENARLLALIAELKASKGNGQ